MPVIDIVLSEEDHQKLQDAYRDMSAVWPRLGHQSLPPTFEQWLGTRVTAGENAPPSNAELDDMRVFHAIEKLITSLHQNGFGLAHVARNGVAPTACAADLAQLLVTDFRLQPQYQKRMQELFEHYLKSAKEIADIAQVGITNRAYGALSEAYRQLNERTGKALDHLGGERAIGRVEGAAALLVNLDVMERTAAKKETDAFKQQVRNAQKTTWVGKVFGGSDNKK